MEYMQEEVYRSLVCHHPSPSDPTEAKGEEGGGLVREFAAS